MPHHEEATTALANDRGPYLVPAGILADVTYLIERWLGVEHLDAFLGDIEEGAFTLGCGGEDLPRTRALSMGTPTCHSGCTALSGSSERTVVASPSESPH